VFMQPALRSLQFKNGEATNCSEVKEVR